MKKAAYLEWAATAAPKERRKHRAKDFDQAMMLPGTFELMDGTGLDPLAAGWLAGITLEAVSSHPHLFGISTNYTYPSLIVAWASCTPDKRPRGIDINERRFERWISVQHDEWAYFYRHTLEALKVVRGLDFDLGSLYDIAALRAADAESVQESFGFICASQFYLNQPKERS